MKRILISILFLLFMAGIAQANPASQALVTTGRAALFNSGSPTCSGIIAANSHFEAAVQADPADQAANLFYALTRIAVTGLENGSGQEFETLLDIFEAFGIARTANDDIINTQIYTDPPQYAGGYLPPATVPEAGLIPLYFNATFAALLDDVLANLSKVDQTIAVTLTAQETGDMAVEIDYGDILLFKGAVNTLKGLLLTFFAYNMDGIETRELIQLSQADMFRIQSGLLDSYPSAFSLISGGAAQLANAKAALLTAVDLSQAAFDYITAETDSQNDDLFSLDQDDMAGVLRELADLQEAKASVTGDRPAQFLNSDNEIESYNFNAVFGSASKNPLDVRESLPRFHIDNEPVRDSFPGNPVLNGIFSAWSDNRALSLETNFQPGGGISIFSAPIALDGNAADWIPETMIFTDITGEDDIIQAPYPANDIRESFMAKDGTYLYMAMKLENGSPFVPANAWESIFYQVHLRAFPGDTSPGQLLIEAGYDVYDPGWKVRVYEYFSGSVRLINTYGAESVAVGTNFIEFRVPLADIDNTVSSLAGKFITMKTAGYYNRFYNSRGWGRDYNRTFLQINTPVKIQGQVTTQPALPGTVLIKLFSSSSRDIMKTTYRYGSGAYELPLLATTKDTLILGAFQDVDGNGIRTSEEPMAYHVLSGLSSSPVLNLNLAFVDSDGDHYPDYQDAFPGDPSEWEDTDNDGIGDNADMDDDNDDLPDTFEILYGLNPKSASGNDGKLGDMDGDGLTNYYELMNNSSPDDYNSVPGSDADGDQDGKDLVSLILNYGTPCSGDCPGDLNLDGLIDSGDLVFFAERFGYVSQ